LVYDEASGEWVPRWGYKGKNKQGENDWLVEVDEKKEREREADGKEGGVRGVGRKERLEKVRRNERKQRANERRARTSGA
jgi:regulator of ribosome biosynthesis